MSWTTPAGRHYALFSFPGFGHVSPVLPLTDELVRRGHRVTHFVAERLAEAARRPGVHVVPYVSEFPEPFGPATSSAHAAQMLVDLMLEGFAPLTEALRVLDGDPPDLVLHDDIAPHTARLLAAHWDVPVIRLYAHFVGQVKATEEPSTESGVDGISPAEVMSQTLLRDSWVAKFAELASLGFGQDMATHALRQEEAAAELVFVPREFHPDGEFSEGHVFVGRSPDPGAETVRWTPPEKGRVALVSLGTSQDPRPEFFRRCAEAFEGTGWHLVMTLGGRVSPEQVGAVPDNVELHQWLPHGAVLPHADVYVGAAGMGSMLEALSHATPVVAVPRSEEQRANAGRVVELGLGLTLTEADVTPETLLERVEAVADDEGIAGRVTTMSGHFAEAGGARRAADEIERRTPVRTGGPGE